MHLIPELLNLGILVRKGVRRVEIGERPVIWSLVLVLGPQVRFLTKSLPAGTGSRGRAPGPASHRAWAKMGEQEQWSCFSMPLYTLPPPKSMVQSIDYRASLLS